MTTPSNAQGHVESRLHELRKRRLQMIDGNLTSNARSAEGGASVRVLEGGYWGFASAPATDAASRAALVERAARNARTLARFGARPARTLPGGTYRGEQRHAGQPTPSEKDCIDRLAELQAWCRTRYPTLKSMRFLLQEEDHDKRVTTSAGSDVRSTIRRATLHTTFVATDDRGMPAELTESLSGKGSLGDLDWSLAAMQPRLDAQHEHLQAKRHAVAARGGAHTVVLAPELAGMLAHEAMGHPCEADLVLGGAVTGGLLGQRVASDLVTMVDLARTYAGAEVMVPVYADDEGTPAEDVVLIRDGLLTGFMSSRETAAQLGIAASGSARAYAPDDEPLVRMRNTAILPGRDRLDAMIAGVDDGYFLMRTSNGQADSTTEFMFGISLGYQIRNGKLGRAIRDTTLSGSAIKVLQTVDAVSDDMAWTCSGYCGKKQPMIVSMGGPALRARAHLGGE
ncbi:MAG: TldD/PmbA family protein [Proteobacteria bacterium]|nr:TldD/PmbA family protein [Pseudomonadota bacterium]